MNQLVKYSSEKLGIFYPINIGILLIKHAVPKTFFHVINFNSQGHGSNPNED